VRRRAGWSVRVKHADGTYREVHYAQDYDLLLPDFIAGGGDGYAMLAGIEPVLFSDVPIPEIVIDFLRNERRVLTSALSGRLRVLSAWRVLQVLCPKGYVNVSTGADNPTGESGNDNDPMRFFYSCRGCPAGLYRSGPRDCTVCSAGTYSSMGTDAQCERCPQHATTLNPAATGRDACRCETGYYGNASLPVTVGGEDQVCKPCPRGGFCPGGTLLPHVAGGFFRSPHNELLFRACLPASSCLGGVTQTECDVDYSGENCGLCDAGAYRSAGACTTCPGVHGGVVSFVIGAAMVAIVSFFVLSSFGRSQEGRRRRALAGLVVGALQDLALLPSYLPGTWPSGLSPLFVVSGVFNLSFDVVGVECYGIRFEQIYLLKMFIPIAFAATLVVIFLLHALYLARYKVRQGSLGVRDMREIFDYYIAAFILFLSFSYTFLSSSILDMVDCVRHDDGTAYLLQSPSQPCFVSSYWAQLPAVVAAIVIYVVGIPLLLSAILFRHRHNFANNQVAVRYQLIVDVYRPHRQGVAILTLVYKFSFVFVKIVLSSSTVIRPVAGLFLAGGFAMYKFRTRPMRDALVRRWDVMHIGVAAALVFGLTLYDKPLTFTERVVLGVAVLFATLPMLVGLVLVIGLYALPILRRVQRCLGCSFDSEEDVPAESKELPSADRIGRDLDADAIAASPLPMFFTPKGNFADLAGDDNHGALHVEVDEKIKEPWGSRYTSNAIRISRNSVMFKPKTSADEICAGGDAASQEKEDGASPRGISAADIESPVGPSPSVGPSTVAAPETLAVDRADNSRQAQSAGPHRRHPSPTQPLAAAAEGDIGSADLELGALPELVPIEDDNYLVFVLGFLFFFVGRSDRHQQRGQHHTPKNACTMVHIVF
jgi:hypothetical protein